ncbi:MAG: DsbA family protein [Acidobacteria bacterium]|nr:DsbA family protein [Acidobacteriota bacterium]
MPRENARYSWSVLVLAALSVVGPPVLAADGAHGPGPGFAQGSATAPVTIQVYSSLTCPSCAKLHLETLRPLAESYVAEGRVRVVHCLLPDQRDPVGLHATRCVHAARRLHRFDEVTAALFSAQKAWMLSGHLEPILAEVLSPEEMKRLVDLVESDELEGEVQGQIEAGRQARVRATPTMLIRHGATTTPIVGAVSYGILARYLDRILEDS